jgi:hypothetical protein
VLHSMSMLRYSVPEAARAVQAGAAALGVQGREAIVQLLAKAALVPVARAVASAGRSTAATPASSPRWNTSRAPGVAVVVLLAIGGSAIV